MVAKTVLLFRPGRCAAAGLLITVAAWTPARAQWAVVDAPAIVQLVKQVQTLQEQLQTTKDQLVQAKQALQSMTGGRGMQLLLGGVVRNYLPVNAAQLSDLMRGSTTDYRTLASGVEAALLNNAILTPAQFALLPPSRQQRLTAAREAVAARQALAGAALTNASGRFASLQGLISAIASASDQKGVLDLQARIGAELAMLQNEHTKLEVIHQAMLAQDAVNQLQERELAVADQGNFISRFRPKP